MKIECVHVCVTGSPCCTVGKKKCVGEIRIDYNKKKKEEENGVPVVAQWLTNSTSKHNVVGLLPGLTQWVKDPALP